MGNRRLCSSRPTEVRSPSSPSTTATTRSAAAAAGWSAACRRRCRRRRTRCGSAPRSTTASARWPGRPRTAGCRQLPQVADALHGDFDVHMLPIDAPTFRAAYNGIANSTLWFVLHQLFDLPTQPVFDAAWRRQWAAYVRYNQAFADAHRRGGRRRRDGDGAGLPPVPACRGMLRELRPDLRIGFFTHTPWVPPDYFTTLPDDVGVRDRRRHARRGRHRLPHRALGRRCSATPRRRSCGREADGVQVFPLGTRRRRDAQARPPARRRQRAAGARTTSSATGCVIGRVDRTELSKNVWRGLLAYRELLRTHPEWRGRVVHVRLQQPVPRGPAGLPRVHRVASSGWRPRSTTSSAPTSGRRSCSRSSTTTRPRSPCCGAATSCS